jgi:pSer/pThr/pTyr-binding forkhead associated (FHA) protein
MNQPGERHVLYLAVTVRNLLAGTLTEEWFSRSPVTVGRREESELQLEADSVSGRHGAFLFGPSSPLQFIDFNSTNGTVVDGVRIQPNVPGTLHEHSVVGIAPFLLIVRTEMAPARADDFEGKTPISEPGEGSAT